MVKVTLPLVRASQHPAAPPPTFPGPGSHISSQSNNWRPSAQWVVIWKPHSTAFHFPISRVSLPLWTGLLNKNQKDASDSLSCMVLAKHSPFSDPGHQSSRSLSDPPSHRPVVPASCFRPSGQESCPNPETIYFSQEPGASLPISQSGESIPPSPCHGNKK